MKIVAICCLLSGLAGADLFPPEGSIVLTQDKSVQLRWDRPTERLVVFENEQPLLDTGVRGTQHTLTVKPGSSYRWVAGTAQGRFSVARQWEYRADAPEGSGQSGKAVAVRLERQGPEMHMTLECGSDRKLYVFSGKGRRFLISSRGGRGRKAVPYHYHESGTAVKHNGTPAGAGGWGGTVEISTQDAPWSDYLKVDVTGGSGGQASFSSPQPGTAGKPGKIVTRILQP